MSNPAIVVIAYNRDASLKRLLSSISKADYSGFENVPLIISIDKSDNTKVAAVAKAFTWEYGEKKVVLHEENLGLKKHVLKCGDFVNEYESIIVLEDDLFVSPNFYSYAAQALDFTSDDERIAGISLYNHRLNVHVREPFYAVDDGFDNYYMQFAQSWGQAYTREQWTGFIEWLSVHGKEPVAASNVPENVSSWSDKSWLKYYIKYVIDTDKYFIYPRVSLTTNFSDEGTHATSVSTELQVPIELGEPKDYVFSSLDESDALYDAYFENVRIGEDKNIIVDLYGYKQDVPGDYLLSSKVMPYNVVKSYGRVLRPIDANVLLETEGEDFYLYDKRDSKSAGSIGNKTCEEKKTPGHGGAGKKASGSSEAEKIIYNYPALSVNKMTKVIKYRLLKK